MTDHSTTTPAGSSQEGRREFEAYWQMNPVTRGIFDRAVEAATTARNGKPIQRVLDIGCGRQSNIVFPGAERVVGTDVDGAGLRGNQTIDEAVEADIVDTELPIECVDAIACVYVLEHVVRPDVVFGKLARALRPGGVMIIAVPNVDAPKARITRATPLWFHRFVYERLLHKPSDLAASPFETVLDPSIRPDRLERLAEVCGLEVIQRVDFEDNKQRQLREKYRLVGTTWRIARGIVRLVTGGRTDAERSDVVMVFQRQQAALGQVADAILRG